MVIALIGILAALVTISVLTITTKAHDARHKTDLRAIAKALDQYAVDYNNTYPISNCNQTIEGISNDSGCAGTELVAGTYTNRIPYYKFEDPDNRYYQYYTYFNQLSYALGVKLDSRNGGVFVITPNGVIDGPDTEAPVWPTNPNPPLALVKSETAGRYHLYWNQASDNNYIVNYDIYTQIDGGSEVLVKTTQLPKADIDFGANYNFSIKIIARDFVGNESAPINRHYNIDINDSSAPTWTESSCVSDNNTIRDKISCYKVDDADRFLYEYYKSDKGVEKSNIAVAPALNTNSQFYGEYTFYNGAIYQYRVYAVDANGNKSQMEVGGSPYIGSVSLPPTVAEIDTAPPSFADSPAPSAKSNNTPDWTYRLLWPSASDNSGIASYSLTVTDSNQSVLINVSGLTTNNYISTNNQGQLIHDALYTGKTIKYTVQATDTNGNSTSRIWENVLMIETHPLGDIDRNCLVDNADWNYVNIYGCYNKSGIYPGDICYPPDVNFSRSINILDYTKAKADLGRVCAE